MGTTAICIETGEAVYFKAKPRFWRPAVAGQIYQSTTNAHISTGDGVGMAVRAGIPPAGYGNGSSTRPGLPVPGTGYRRLPW